MNKLRIIAATGFLACAACAAWAVLALALRRPGPLPVIAATTLTCGLLALGAYAAYLLDLRRVARIGRCSKCGYDLRGLDRAKRCPECGRPIDIDT